MPLILIPSASTYHQYFAVIPSRNPLTIFVSYFFLFPFAFNHLLLSFHFPSLLSSNVIFLYVFSSVFSPSLTQFLFDFFHPHPFFCYVFLITVPLLHFLCCNVFICVAFIIIVLYFDAAVSNTCLRTEDASSLVTWWRWG